MPLAASLCYAMGIVVTRWRCHDRAGLALTIVHNTLYTAIGLLGLLLVPCCPSRLQEMKAKGDKLAEQSISNALSNLKKQNSLKLEEGSYIATA